MSPMRKNIGDSSRILRDAVLLISAFAVGVLLLIWGLLELQRAMSVITP